MFEHTSSQESVKMYIFVIKTSKVVKKNVPHLSQRMKNKLFKKSELSILTDHTK